MDGTAERFRNGDRTSTLCAFVNDPLPFVGRGAERDRLLDALRPEGGRIALVVGDAGIGKTRLLRETLALLLNDAALTGNVIWCGGDEFDQDRPFATLLPLFEKLGLDAARSRGGALHRIDEVLDELANVGALEAGTVIVVDDAQWADAATWRVLRLLSRLIDDARIAGTESVRLVVAARSPLAADVAGWMAGSMPSAFAAATRIDLGGLGADDLNQLDAAQRGSLAVDVGLLVQRTGGNPLLIEELLRNAATTAPGSHSELTTTASLRAAVLSRLVGLQPKHRQLLRYAALLGTRFTLTDLAHVTSKSVVEVIETLDAALSIGVVVPDGTELRFRHDLVAECFRDDQPDAVRHACHRHIAETLAARGAAPTRIAEHYVLAAAALDDEQSKREAAHWLEHAAATIRPQSLPTAIGLLERSIALSSDTLERDRRRVELAPLLLLAGRIEAAESESRSVLESPQVPQDLVLRARSALAVVASLRGPMQAAVANEHYDHVLAIVESMLGDATLGDATLGDSSTQRKAELLGIRAETLAGKSIVTVYTGDLATAATLAGDALDLAERTGSRSAVSRAHETLALVAMAESDSARARHHADRAVAWFGLENGPWAMVVTPHLTAALVAVTSGDLAGAVERCVDGLRVTETTDHLMPRLYLLPCLAVFRMIQGDLDEALRLSTITNDLVADWCPTHPTPVTRALIGYVEYLRGVPTAASHVDPAAAELGASGAQLAIADLAAWMVAMVWESDGRTEQAVGLLRLVWELIGEATGALVMAPDLVRLHRQTDREFAERVVSVLTARAARAPGDRTELVRKRSLAILESDVDALQEVADRYAAIDTPLTAAWTRFDAAQAALDAGATPSVFEAALRSAISDFDRLDAPAVSARLRALGRSGGVALRPARKSSTNQLTDTERRVAELAANGRTNREIGSALYMSGRTAEAHLGRVFSKLGVKNRVELTARLAR